LVEWLSEGEGSGAATLLLLSAVQRVVERGQLVVIDPAGEFYPPAASRMGVPWERTVLIRPAVSRDTFWAWEQALRCPGVAVTVGWLEQVDDRTFRRFQLASEQGGGLGLLWRAARYSRQPSWADVRVRVRPLQGSSTGRRFRLERLRCRGERGPRTVDLELNDETGAVRVVTELASSTPAARAAGA
jgi:protein ImuA